MRDKKLRTSRRAQQAVVGLSVVGAVGVAAVIGSQQATASSSSPSKSTASHEHSESKEKEGDHSSHLKPPAAKLRHAKARQPSNNTQNQQPAPPPPPSGGGTTSGS